MRKQQGFTVIEILVVIVLLGIGCWLFFSSKNATEQVVRDQQRKVAINSMYYSLEEVFYEENGYYPDKISSKKLRSVDPELFTDPNGFKLGDPGADYRYEGQNCGIDNKCASYKLSSKMEREDRYQKSSRREKIRKN